eukprot:CAMPEP_0206524588 /NCGR_PEP_ID=MMETSP0324_2-20121206/68263_1 /ASSEMBLY_ACC=CAM_ASM_000836 /TAXON_ID=2866 /ORGANISM="Crypthecodinium cohnii, Strain Seligo" /LENGTH=692 /DNA_ID=CAMNT_0054019163 /DNA_START=48 /DNA_END=2123 /DNA_ORIENTATION=-
MIAHSISALRSLGVTKFLICRGWQSEAFDVALPQLGEGVRLIDCPDYAKSGMLESLRMAMPHLSEGGFYLLYGDIIFRPSLSRALAQQQGTLSIVVDHESPGIQSKGFESVEIVAAGGNAYSSTSRRWVKRIGKDRRILPEDSLGEFAGIVKVAGGEARKVWDEAFDRLWSAPKPGSRCLPWWIEPVMQASLCEFLQLLVEEGHTVDITSVFGGWHEVNTPQDLTRAQNDTPLFLAEGEVRAQVAAMGSCLLSEANDLKRPLPIVAKELNIDMAKLDSLLKGDLGIGEALDVLRKMSEVYPVPLNDLWLDADDTKGGVRLTFADDSEATSRVLNRLNKDGERTPYYEYRDAAMSRCSQFRPEWIKQLRVVKSGNPLDPDVQMNNGHLMMQMTMFIGPVDFYYRDRHGKVHRCEMNTGDSNFISSFVPHSFTSRDENKEALIIAVTYGGSVRRAFTEFSRIGAKEVFSLAGDLRNPAQSRHCTLKRFLDAECMSVEDLADATNQVSSERVQDLVAGAEPTMEELRSLAAALHVRVSDLMIAPLEEHEEVVVTKSSISRKSARSMKGYTLSPLARTRHQPDLKTFDIEVLDTATPGEDLRCGLHSFIYHFGSEPVEFRWQGRGQCHSSIMRPGDSAYVSPMVVHNFSVCKEPVSISRTNPNGGDCGKGRRLLVVRIPGHLSGETLSEFGTFSAH